MFHNYCNRLTVKFSSCIKHTERETLEKKYRKEKIKKWVIIIVKEKGDLGKENFWKETETEKPIFWSEETTCRWVTYTHHLCQCPHHHQLSYQFECQTPPYDRGACTCWGSAPDSLCSEVRGMSPSVCTELWEVQKGGGTTLGPSRGLGRVRYGLGLYIRPLLERFLLEKYKKSLSNVITLTQLFIKLINFQAYLNWPQIILLSGGCSVMGVKKGLKWSCTNNFSFSKWWKG